MKFSKFILLLIAIGMANSIRNKILEEKKRTTNLNHITPKTKTVKNIINKQTTIKSTTQLQKAKVEWGFKNKIKNNNNEQTARSEKRTTTKRTTTIRSTTKRTTTIRSTTKRTTTKRTKTKRTTTKRTTTKRTTSKRTTLKRTKTPRTTKTLEKRTKITRTKKTTTLLNCPHGAFKGGLLYYNF